MGNDWIQQRLSSQLTNLEQASLRRSRRCVDALSTTECVVDGRRCLSFATNDYLGLTRHPRVLQAFAESAATQAGAGASGMIAGRSSCHVRLEEALARFESTESAVLFPSGFAANMGTLTSLIGPKDAVFCDRENHASLIDGCRASSGKFYVYDRGRIQDLGNAIERRRREFDAVFIVTDSVFSMDGTIADLPAICDIADQHNAAVIVDEAHGTGVFGVKGRGVCELQNVEHRVAVRIGTMSKALGGLGGFVTGSSALCEWLWNSARSQFFSTALPPSVCSAAQAALQVIADEPDRRATLQSRSQFARQQLREAELEMVFDGFTPPGSPIIAILLGDDGLAVRTSRKLLEKGLFLPAVRPPTVSAGDGKAANVSVLRSFRRANSASRVPASRCCQI